MIAAALVLLALVGFANAVYFTLLAYRLLAPGVGVLPRVCRLSDHACEAVVHTKYGRLLGIPNSVPALGYYLLVVAAAGTRDPRLLDASLVGATVTVLLAPYLLWALFVKLKTP